MVHGAVMLLMMASAPASNEIAVIAAVVEKRILKFNGLRKKECLMFDEIEASSNERICASRSDEKRMMRNGTEQESYAWRRGQ